MFGYVVASLSAISEEEKARYQAVYCGLCHELKERYGQVSRLCLTYDLTFYILLASSLQEPPETCGPNHCVMHPGGGRTFARNRATAYAADLTVALAYHKCLDDINDDQSLKARASAALLKSAYHQARQRIPAQCVAIEQAMAAIAQLEAGGASTPPDAAAHEFGRLLGQLFAADQGFWEEAMGQLGYHLGRFVYLMDAAVDYAEDSASGSYNPLVYSEFEPQEMRVLLAGIAGEAARVFERLPLEQDAHLMRSVLYSGVWQKFNKLYAPKESQEARD